MTIRKKDFVVKPGRNVRLEDWPTLVDPVYASLELRLMPGLVEQV